MNYKDLFTDLIDFRGRLIPGFIIMINLVALTNVDVWREAFLRDGLLSEITEHFPLVVYLCAYIISLILGSTNLYVMFRILERVFDKPSPVKYYTDVEPDARAANFFRQKREEYEYLDSNQPSASSGVCRFMRLLDRRLRFQPKETKEEFDRVKHELIQHSPEVSKDTLAVESRVNFNVGMCLPLGMTVFTLLHYDQTVYVFIAMAAFVVNLIEFHRHVCIAEPRLVYNRYYTQFRTDILDYYSPHVNNVKRLSADEFRQNFHQYCTCLLDIPPNAHYRSYECDVDELLDGRLYPVWFVDRSRSTFVPFRSEDATPITFRELAMNNELAKQKLSEPIRENSEKFDEPIVTAYDNKTNTRIVYYGYDSLLYEAVFPSQDPQTALVIEVFSKEWEGHAQYDMAVIISAFR